MLADLSTRYGIPTTLSPLFHSAAAPGATEQVMAAVERGWAQGARVWPQVQTRPIDISWTMGQRSIMFLAIPGWWQVLSMGDQQAKLDALADPKVKEQLIAGMDQAVAMRGPGMDPGNYLIRDVALDRNRDLVGRTLGDVAAERGTRAAELLIDLSVEEELGTWFMRAGLGHSDPDAVGALLAHPLVHVGASDGGAHVGSFATYGDTGFLLSRYVRETGALSLEAAVKKITADPATIWGIPGRGELRAGYAADVVVFDPDTIGRGPEIASHDFPGGGTRWIRRAEGVDAVVVNGTVTWTADDGYDAAARAGAITVPV
jgi:N-acyl-D-aspartate/D-glutamate deacylase